MDANSDDEQRAQLTEAMTALACARSLDKMIDILRRSARAIAGAEGITVIRRIGDRVSYIAEDALQPLWTGQDFAIEACVSGIAILEKRPIVIPDIYADSRVPHDAYRPTFVRSMAMYPIGLFEPSMAIGAYWGRTGPIETQTSIRLSSLARYAGITIDRLTEGRGANAA